MPSPQKQQWQNPKDVMKSLNVKRQLSQSKSKLARSKSVSQINNSRRPQLHRGASTPQSSLHDSGTNQLNSLKRKNPFIREESSLPPETKRRSIFNLTPSAPSSAGREKSGNASIDNHKGTQDQHRLLNVLKKADDMVRSTEKLQNSTTSRPVLQNEEFDKKMTPGASAQITKETSRTATQKINPCVENRTKASREIEHVSSDPPTDWSLKTKMRIVVESGEESFKKIPGIDAKNINMFVHHNIKDGEEWKDLDIYQKLRCCCLHYSYPQMPWIKTFPRLATDFRAKGASSLYSNSDDVLQAVQSDWINVFTSMYQQLRGGICPYFYVCTHQFTVLFRCQRHTAGKASLSALLSPSTRGFREMLTKEDVEFRLPNIDMHKVSANDLDQTKHDSCKDSSNNSQSDESVKNSADGREKEGDGDNIDKDDDDDEDDDDINDPHGASRWLEGMGLDKKDFPSLDPLKVKLQRDSYREIDNRPQSMVYVEGADVHGFFNFLLNYQSCIASSGPQHGLPPTLLSPTPFVGGSLVQNSVRYSFLRDTPTSQPGTTPLLYSHVFEVSGPIMPHHTLNVAALLKDSHKKLQGSREDEAGGGGSSTMIVNTHLPSAALNCLAVNDEENDRLTLNWHKLFVNFTQVGEELVPSVRDSLNVKPVLDSGTYVREMRITASGFKWV